TKFKSKRTPYYYEKINEENKELNQKVKLLQQQIDDLKLELKERDKMIASGSFTSNQQQQTQQQQKSEIIASLSKFLTPEELKKIAVEEKEVEQQIEHLQKLNS